MVAGWGYRGWDRISYVLPQVSFGKNKELIGFIKFLQLKNKFGLKRFWD